MNKDRVSKNTWAVVISTAILSIFGGWSAGNERQAENTTRISIVEEKCSAQEKERHEDRVVDKEILQKLDALSQDMAEVKSDVKILRATKADKYAE